MTTANATTYTNIDDAWGDMTAATVADYQAMAGIYGVDPDITSDDDGIYINGVMVATADC